MTTSTTETLLEGVSLSKRYGGVQAVRDVSFRLNAGEVIGLVGPNGAGKTTLVDLIDGAQRSDEGRLLLQGRRLAGPPSRRARAGLARTFQQPQLALELTVRENILLGAAASRLADIRGMVTGLVSGMLRPGGGALNTTVERVADSLGIGDITRRCRDLTLGEQRLIEVARAVAQSPSVLLLDEPFAGSDAQGVEAIADAIRAVAAQGHGVVLVDHNVDIVTSIVDSILLLNHGAVAFDGDPQSCLQSHEMQEVYFGTGGEYIDA